MFYPIKAPTGALYNIMFSDGRVHTARAELSKSGSKLLLYEQLLFYTKKTQFIFLAQCQTR